MPRTTEEETAFKQLTKTLVIANNLSQYPHALALWKRFNRHRAPGK